MYLSFLDAAQYAISESDRLSLRERRALQTAKMERAMFDAVWQRWRRTGHRRKLASTTVREMLRALELEAEVGEEDRDGEGDGSRALNVTMLACARHAVKVVILLFAHAAKRPSGAVDAVAGPKATPARGRVVMLPRLLDAALPDIARSIGGAPVVGSEP